MLAFLYNISPSEIFLAAVIAVLVFGKNLPEVAGRVFAQVRRVRRAVDEMRRETGIDHDVRDFRRTMREIEQEAHVADPLRGATRAPAAEFLRHIEEHPQTDPAAPPAAAEGGGTDPWVAGAEEAGEAIAPPAERRAPPGEPMVDSEPPHHGDEGTPRSAD